VVHSRAFSPPLRAPMIGDLVKLSGLGSLGRPFNKHHGVGVVNRIHQPTGKRIRYHVKWLKSDELMAFHEEDLLIISNVHLDR
jgi:hypothetical protein